MHINHTRQKLPWCRLINAVYERNLVHVGITCNVSLSIAREDCF